MIFSFVFPVCVKRQRISVRNDSNCSASCFVLSCLLVFSRIVLLFLFSLSGVTAEAGHVYMIVIVVVVVVETAAFCVAITCRFDLLVRLMMIEFFFAWTKTSKGFQNRSLVLVWIEFFFSSLSLSLALSLFFFSLSLSLAR